MKFKKIFKYCSAFIIAAFIYLFVSQNGVSSAVPDVVMKLQINSPVMEVNGEKREVDPGRTTAPLVINGRTMVPVRTVTETFGGTAEWNEKEGTVTLQLDGDTVKLTPGSTEAGCNGKKHTLDAAPAVIEGRTMLPIRFIAESFNFGVAWDSAESSVYIIHDTLTEDEYNALTAVLPPYSGNPYTVVNENKPYFKSYEIIKPSFEYYSKLDFLKRCNVCQASASEDLMPSEKRGNISSVKPTGWVNVKYDNISGGYLYNRCHLLGYQLTGENANVRNLITGTRYLNVDGMLPFENKVAEYIKTTKNHVMYRVTPVFVKNNLVADGVLMEAYSVDDNGEGITFCVYCYNVQPGIIIDYGSGRSRAA